MITSLAFELNELDQLAQLAVALALEDVGLLQFL